MIKFDSLEIDPVLYGSQGNAILGIRGSGKTYTATFFAEQLEEAGIPFVAFDPIGVWRFLRRPGAGKGYPVVVAGGAEGDLPLTVESAPEIVRAAMRNGLSIVIDLFDINLSKADWKRIVMASLRVLLHENAEHGLRHIFLEEAAEFAPQRPGADQTQVYAEVEKLARMGGNARLGYTLINQRSEEVSKACLELCDSLYLHRQKGRNSLTALQKWLDFGDPRAAETIIASMATLPTGECWAWLGETSAPVHCKVPTKSSLHPDRTTVRGEVMESRPPVDVADFVAAMKAALESSADPKPNSEPEGKKPSQNITRNITAELAKARTDGYAGGYKAGATATAQRLGKMVVDFAGAFAIATAEELPPDTLHSTPVKLDHVTGGPTIEFVPPTEHKRRIQKSAEVPGVTHPRPPEGLTGPQAKVLQSLAWWKSVGIEQPVVAQVAILAGWTPSGSNIKDRLTELVKAEHVARPAAGVITLTASGAALAPQPPKVSFAEAIEGILTNPQRSVYSHLLAQTDPIRTADLATLIGWAPDGSNIKDRLTELTKLTIVVRPNKGVVALADWVRAGLRPKSKGRAK